MNFGKWLGVVLVGLGCGSAAHAQAGVYVGYSATRMSGITCFTPQSANPQESCYNSNASATTSSNNHVNPSGVTVGAYYDFLNVGLVKLGVDLRYSDDHANKSATSLAGGKDTTGVHSVLAGVRGSVRTPVKWLRPYAQISVGWANSNVTEPFGTSTVLSTSVVPPRLYDNFLQYEAFAGADVHISPFFDLRAIELGVGNMNRVGSGTAGTTSSVGLKSIGAGLVFHLPSK